MLKVNNFNKFSLKKNYVAMPIVINGDLDHKNDYRKRRLHKSSFFSHDGLTHTFGITSLRTPRDFQFSPAAKGEVLGDA